MKITSIERGKKSRRLNIFVDFEYSFSVEEITLVNENLFKDKELTQDEIEAIKQRDLVQKFTFRAIDQLGRRPRSEKEISDYIEGKLRNKKFYDISKDEILEISRKVLEKLKSSKYIDDTEFATWWVKSRNEHRPRSFQVLKQELFKKGIDKEIIRQVLENNLDKDMEIRSAMKIGEKKLETLKPNLTKFEQKTKISSYLAGKGYGWEIISEVTKSIF